MIMVTKHILGIMLKSIFMTVGLVSNVVGRDSAMCSGTHTLLQSPGDAVIAGDLVVNHFVKESREKKIHFTIIRLNAAFVDTNYGPHCNESTMKGFQEVSTALYVVQALNKYDYVPGLSLGLKIFDTCHDSMSVYKQALMEAVDFECVDYYELGVLVPSIYSPVLQPLGDYNVLPVSTYKAANMTKALVDIMVEFISTAFEVIDLLLVDTHPVLGLFLDASRLAGICVKSVNEIAELENDTEAVIAVVANKDSIISWTTKGLDYGIMGRKTWLVLPLDDSYIDDIVPEGSYVIKSESFDFDLLQEFPSLDQFLETSEEPVIHSPYLLGIGKSIVEIARVLREMQKQTCPHDTTCVLPRFDSKIVRKVSDTEVYEALHILPKSHTLKYVVSRRIDADSEELFRVASYEINVVNSRVTAETPIPKMPKLCVSRATIRCQKCANFKMRLDELDALSKDSDSAKGFLKPGVLIPIFLTVMACGTVALIVVVVIILYRYFTAEVLDGNLTLTILLVFANICLLQAVLPFCMNDNLDAATRESINARKILVSTLSIGTAFALMLSRALFLAFSTGGVFTTHINGYLQLLMVFFMTGVEVAISTMYFVLSTADSAHVVRSSMFIALLGYDIFLLIVLFVVCCFITRIQRNYREGECFFCTVIGLLLVWSVWLTCFAVVDVDMRDNVVSSGIITTAYLIIIGILIPRTYYMVTHLDGGKDILRRFKTTDLGPDPRNSTVARQTHRRFPDYVHPLEGIKKCPNPKLLKCPNYYGRSSPDPRYLVGGQREASFTDATKITNYSNYGYHRDMQKADNSFVIPCVLIENPEGYRNPVASEYHEEVCFAQPRSLVCDDEDCIETDVYVEGTRLSTAKKSPNEAYPVSGCSSPTLYQSEGTIREVVDEDREVTRITRL